MEIITLWCWTKEQAINRSRRQQQYRGGRGEVKGPAGPPSRTASGAGTGPAGV